MRNNDNAIVKKNRLKKKKIEKILLYCSFVLNFKTELIIESNTELTKLFSNIRTLKKSGVFNRIFTILYKRYTAIKKRYCNK